MVHVDLEARTIEVGVRDLIASGAAVRPRGGGSSLRAQLGYEVHARYQKRREAELGEAFTAERAVRLSLFVDGFDATIAGRMDGVIETDDTVTIEEVKSVVEHGGPEAKAARLQVATYALALRAGGETRPIVLDVVSISIADDEERRTSVTFNAEETRAQLERLLRGVIGTAERARRKADARARWSETMVFPHDEIREGQAMLVDGIEDAFAEGRPLLAQAPTGTGKTAASLFGSIRLAAREGHRVFYATPKTTQHAHVAETFEALCRASPFEADDDVSPPRAVSLHARSRLCNLGAGRCDRRTCPRLAQYVDRAPPVLEQLAREHAYVGTEVLLDTAKRHTLCAYELASDLAQDADLVIGDFNYIFDPNIAMLANGGRSTVVVVDEAHNLFDRARAYSSSRITLRQIESAEHAMSPNDPMAMVTARWLADLRGLIQQVASKPPDPNDSTQLEHQGIFELAYFPVGFDALASRARLLLLRRLARAPEAWAGDGDDPDPVAEVLRSVIRCSEATDTFSDDLVSYAIGPRVRGGAGVGVVCIDPARALTRRHREAAGVVCMSATLAPLDYWGDVLGLEAMDAVQLRVPSPFSADQRRVVIVPSLSTTYRDRNASIPEIANTMAQVVALRPGPYMAFFPSFAYLNAVHKQLPRFAQILAQAPRSSLADRRALLDRFVAGQGPRVLLAVSGGVFGEGIDLPGDALLGAFVVGPCLPPIGFQRAAMARHFEATRQAGFAYAMIYPGLQRVVQAAGRVIRREDDRGIVVLMGRRFVRPEIVEALPEDWYQYDPSELVPEDPIAALGQFWDGW